MIQKFLKIINLEYKDYDRVFLNFSATADSYRYWVSILCGLVFFIFLYGAIREAPSRGRKIFLFFLHSFIFLVAIFILFEPSIRLAKTERIKSHICFLVDTSQSMNANAGDKGLSRISTVEKFLSDNMKYIDSFNEKYVVQFFGFDRNLKQLNYVSPGSKLGAEGKRTFILESLGELKEQLGSATISGIVLISDGADNGRLRELSSTKNKKELEEELGFLKDYGVINTVGVGVKEDLKDIAILSLSYDEYGFVHSPFVVTVTISSFGISASNLTITLKQEGEVVATQVFNPVASRATSKVEFEFVPRKVGRFIYQVELPVLEGEASSENNRAEFPLTILRDEVRILYIVGNPSWDEKFLRLALKKNPSIDLVSFYILRDYYDDPRANEDELALIPFPTDELFTKELNNFDMVIFQNYFGKEFMMPAYIENLKKFVLERGGALLMIGGPKSFLKDDFNLPLEEIMPFAFFQKLPNYLPFEFKAKLTEAGIRHPVTRLLDDELENKKLWESFPLLFGFNQSSKENPDSVVLASGLNGAPLIALREVGKGRTMMVATDSLWRWHFLMEGEGKSSRYYQLFWERAVRWLIKDPEMRYVSLNAGQSRYQLGEKAVLIFEVLDSSYQPIESADVNLEVLSAPQAGVVEQLQGVSVGNGKYRFEFEPKKKGGYKFRAKASLKGKPIGEDEAIFVVEDDNRELWDLSVHYELLELISQLTGGKFIKTDDPLSKLSFPDLAKEQIIGAQDKPIWDNWFTFGFMTLYFSILWVLRRKWGLR